jgi:hypothetical protein
LRAKYWRAAEWLLRRPLYGALLGMVLSLRRLL